MPLVCNIAKPRRFRYSRYDPSRTALLRRAYVAEMRRRFGRLRAAVWRFVYVEDRLGLAKPVANAPPAPSFKFETDDKKLRGFNRWLKSQVDAGILESNPTTGDSKGDKPWTHKYIDSAYRKGLVRSYTELKPDMDKPLAFYQGSRSQFLESSFAAPERVSKLRMLYTRSYEDLKGITSQMANKMSRILSSGLANGEGPMNVARQMNKMISAITRDRANVLARTEMIHAHAEGQLDGMSDLGVSEATAQVEFSTSGDDGVCPECEDLEGTVYTVAEARGIIPVHPNCRCAWMPVVGD